MRYTILICFLSLAVVSVSAQSTTKSKKWQITVVGKHFRTKGVLYNVTDSSVVLWYRKGVIDEVNFDMINKIKLRPASMHGAEIAAASFLVEGLVGGIVIGSSLSAGKAGEPRAMAGVVGGIGGGVAVGLISAIVNPLIVDKIVTKKIFVHHDSIFYESLKSRLKPYCLTR